MTLDQFYKSTDHLPIMQYADSFLLNLDVHEESPASVELATDLMVKMAAYSENLAGIIVNICKEDVLKVIVDKWAIPVILRVHDTSPVLAQAQRLSPYIFAIITEGATAKAASYALHYYNEYFLDRPIISEGAINDFTEARYRLRLGAKALVLRGSVNPMFYQDIYDYVPEKAKPNELPEE